MQTVQTILKPCLTTAILLIGSVAHAQFGDLVKQLQETDERLKETASQLLEESSAEAAPMSEVQQKHMCGFARADAGKVGLMEQIKSQTTQLLLQEVAKSLNVDGIELPEEIQSPCYAEVRWTYVERKSGFWAEQVVAATNKALEALDIDHQIEAERLFKEGPSDTSYGREEFVTISKELDHGLELVEQSMAEKEAVNEVLLSEARGAMRGAMTYGAEILGWDQRLVEFMGDNTRWTMNRATRVQNFAEHVKLVGDTFGSLQKITAAERASETDGIVLENASTARQQQIAAEDAAFEAQVVADLNL
jgi:hypothetical protein